MKAWLLAIRPKTLTAAVVPIFVGHVLAQRYEFNPVWWVTACALGAALAIQIATNLFNDAIDFKKGADTAERLGPTRVTQKGLKSEREVYFCAAGFLIVAFILGVPLVLRGGWPIVAVGVVSLILAYGYTGGPYPLAYHGLGDLFVCLFFGPIAVGGVFYLHTLTLDWPALVAGFQIGLLSTVLIAINNLRDIEQDKKAHKKTLPVRWGVRFARVEIALLILSAFVLLHFWRSAGSSWATYLPLLTAPLAAYISYKVFVTAPSAIYNLFLALSAALHLGFGMLLSLGLILG